MRNHKLVRFKHREARADRQFDALEERERAATAKVRFGSIDLVLLRLGWVPACLRVWGGPSWAGEAGGAERGGGVGA